MSEPTRLPPSGSGANPPIGTRTLTATTTALAGRLQVGMQVELMPSRSIDAERIETRLRPLGSGSGWSNSLQAQLTTALPTNALQAAIGQRPGALPMLRAEVVATSPALVLKLVSPTEPSASTQVRTPVAEAGSREWLGQQFRQHWPESRPLAATLESITARLTKEVGTDAVAAQKALAQLPTLNANETMDSSQLQRAVATLIDQLASASELTDPEQLSVAVSRSGLWMEALLVQAALDPARSNDLKLDLKAQLLTLAQRLRFQGPSPAAGHPPGQTTAGPSSETNHPPSSQGQRAVSPQMPPDGSTSAPRPGTTPEQVGPRTQSAMPESAALPKTENASSTPDQRAAPEGPRAPSLARDVEGMLKQVVTKQLQSLDTSSGQTQWVLELPFRTPTGVLGLEADIRREPNRTEHERDTWSMRLRLDLPKLGPLNILLILRNERLNASLQAGDVDGAERIGQHLGELRARLEEQEIEVASLHAGHRPFDRPPPPFTDPLVREQA